jgi:hypothetical protein
MTEKKARRRRSLGDPAAAGITSIVVVVGVEGLPSDIDIDNSWSLSSPVEPPINMPAVAPPVVASLFPTLLPHETVSDCSSAGEGALVSTKVQKASLAAQINPVSTGLLFVLVQALKENMVAKHFAHIRSVVVLH